jgi:hypothetical protein
MRVLLEAKYEKNTFFSHIIRKKNSNSITTEKDWYQFQNKLLFSGIDKD